MDCKETQTWLNGYVDGELDLARTVEIEKHLAGCAGCSRARDGLRTLQDSLHAASLEFRCPEILRTKIAATVRRETAYPIAPPNLRRRYLAAAAALLLTAVGIGFALRPTANESSDGRIAQEVVASHVRSLLADHLTDVASSDRHTVKPWFAGKLDFAPSVVDLSPEGFPLIGGRLDYLEQRPVAALVYGRRKHTINLFIWPSERASGGALQSTSTQGYQIAHWNESGTTYWAISDLNSGELTQFVQLIRSYKVDGDAVHSSHQRSP